MAGIWGEERGSDAVWLGTDCVDHCVLSPIYARPLHRLFDVFGEEILPKDRLEDFRQIAQRGSLVSILKKMNTYSLLTTRTHP